jgi:hypothetical protein
MRNHIFVLLITALSLSGAVSVISPNGGEILLRGTQFEIKWYYNLPENIKIELYRNGSFFESIAGSLPNSGSYFWTVPQEGLIGSDFKVKISSVSNPGIYNDYSDNFFTIELDPEADPVIKIISPVGGESLIIGDIASISWMDNIDSKVKIELLQEDIYKTTLTDSTESDGTYEWPVTADLYGNGYKIKISSIEEPSLSDSSGSSFKIIPEGIITIISPNGGESYSYNGEIGINWTDDISENVKIDLYKYDNFLMTIIPSTPSDGSFTWNIPLQLVGEYFSVKVSSADYEIISGTSQGYFEVVQNTDEIKILYEYSTEYYYPSRQVDYRKKYNYSNDGKIYSWERQNYTSEGYVTDPDLTYSSTYYTSSYEMKNMQSDLGGQERWSQEDRYIFDLSNRLTGKYFHKYTWFSDISYESWDNTIYSYSGDLINYISYQSVLEGFNKDYNIWYIKYFFYDDYNRITQQNNHNHFTEDTLEVIDWKYPDNFNSEIITKEKIDGVWQNKSKVLYSNDSYNQLRKTVSYEWKDYNWQPKSMDSLCYYDGGILKESINFYYSTSSAQFEQSKKIVYEYNTPVGIEDQVVEVQEFVLYQNYPNPFNPVTAISYALPEAAQVELNVYNLNGQLVKSLVNGKMDKGVHKAEFNGADLTSGMYIYNLKVDGKSVQSKKMMLLK